MFASSALLTQRALLRLHLMGSGLGLSLMPRRTQGPYSQNESLYITESQILRAE